MTLDIKIGQLSADEFCEYVDLIELPAAPAFPGAGVSRHTNRISIPYGAVDDLRNTSDGVAALFDGKYPEVRRLEIEDLAEVMIARLFYEAEHPGALPAFDGDGPTGEENATLARLLLIEWWIGWALANADCPVMEIY